MNRTTHIVTWHPSKSVDVIECSRSSPHLCLPQSQLGQQRIPLRSQNEGFHDQMVTLLKDRHDIVIEFLDDLLIWYRLPVHVAKFRFWPGGAAMQPARPALIRFLRISPSLDWLDDMEPLVRTKPAVLRGARWCRKCCTHAKLMLPSGETPYSHRLSSRSRSPPQSETLEGGLARM